MDKIILKNMCFYGYHGVLGEEKRLGQKFYLDAVLFSDLTEAGRTDDLKYTANYAAAFETIRRIVEGQRFDLIESLAHHVCEALLRENSRIEKVQLTVRKPSAPVEGCFDYMAVEIERSRGDAS